MRKIIDTIMVNRVETKNKWWHRLFSILLLSSTLVVATVSFVIVYYGHNHNWITSRPIIFNLESNYQKGDGMREGRCYYELFMFDVSEDEPLINSGGVWCEGVLLSDSKSKQYARLYNQAKEDLVARYGLSKYFDTSICKPTPLDVSIECKRDVFTKGLVAEKNDPSYSKYQNESKRLEENLYVKIKHSRNLKAIFGDIILWVMIPIFSAILWVTIWGAVIYRAVLYVIFGERE